jgi:hypothetical protein
MVFERGQAYVIAYRKGGVGRSPFRTVLVCSTRGDVVYAIPAGKIAEFEAERKVCELLEIPFYGKRPEPQTFFVSRIKAVGNKVKEYRKYMDAKVSKIVKEKLDKVENAS